MNKFFVLGCQHIFSTLHPTFMEAPIETTVSAPETIPESPTVEPQAPESTTTVTEPIPAEAPNTDTAPVTTEETPQAETIPEFDEQALEGILDEIAASANWSQKFTFKEDKTETTPTTDIVPSTEPKKEWEETPITPDDKVILDELTQVAQIYSDENKSLQIDKQNLTENLEKERIAKEEALTLASQVDDIWKDVVTHIPILDQYAEAKLKWEVFELPPILREDVQKALQEHPIVGPLNRALIAWETLPISAFVKSLADYRRSTAPQMADARTSVPTKGEKPGAQQNRLPGLHGVKPVTAT